MIQNPPQGYGRVTPYLLYEDTDAMLEWLNEAFGFTESVRMRDENGRTNHAEVKTGDAVIMMGSPGTGYRNPKNLGGVTQLTYVYVDDLEAHYEVAKRAGARILREPEDQFYGDRTYAAEDPEGHQWHFAQHVRDVPPEEMP